MPSDGNGHGLDIRRLPLASLRPAGYNPRTITAAAKAGLAASIDRWGCVEPVIWNQRSGNVVGGHQRLDALVARGDTETDVVVVDLDAVEEKALNVALNNQAIAGEWDWGKLSSLLPEIEAVDGLDAALLGFGALGEDLLANLPDEPDDGLTDPDEVPEHAGPPITRPGDLWALGEHRLLCGDCTDALVVERLLAADRPSLLVTSPPYLDARDYGGADLSLDTLAGFVPLWGLICDLVVVNLGIIRRDNAVVRYWDAYIQAAEDAGLKLLSWNVWDRGQPWSVAQNTAMFPLEHEFVLVFGEERQDVRCTVENKTPGMRTGITNRQADGTLNRATPKIVRTHRPLGSVFRSPPHIGRDIGHPAMFPIALPVAYIEACSDTGAVVAEPFSGSGTTLIACEQLSRRCRAVEIEPRYCDVALRRWAAFTGRDPVREDGVTWSSLVTEDDDA